MKYNTLKATFKGGMVSPRLRGRERDGDLTSTAEKIENFVVDKVGGASKRSPLEVPKKQPFLELGFSQSFDATPAIATYPHDHVYFSVNLRGREFVFRFNCMTADGNPAFAKAINAIANEVNPSTVADYQSTFLQITNANGDYHDVRPYAPYYTGAATLTNNGDLTAFSQTQGTPVKQVELKEYLHTVLPRPAQMTKISDATVVFTCGTNDLNSIHDMSFTVSLVNLPVISGLSPSTEVFVILPYFVNVRAFVANFGKNAASPDMLSPIQPCNFPFNPINTDKSMIINAAVYANQTGPDAAAGVLTYPGNKISWLLTIPKDVAIDANFGIGYTTPDALFGKFIIIPTADNTKDCVFFITSFDGSTGTNYRFTAIQITGGVPENNSIRWKLSTFGGQTHPRAVGWCFNRLVYGNAGIDKSAWWASAIHPSQITGFQSFMQFSLTQDKTSDVSGMKYEGVTTPAATDIYRYGITSRVPNLAPISFIQSRRRIHFGTLGGECQLTINNGSFEAYSFDQLIVRSNSASLFASSQGDGKFYYIANSGEELRYISTEDKDYESVDGLVTTGLTGLKLKFDKIQWYEKLGTLVARTEDKRFFFITLHADTEIKAITEFISEFEIHDFCVNLENLYFIIIHKGYKHICRYQEETDLGGDIAKLSGGFDLGLVPVFFLEETVNLFHAGVEYEMEINADGTFTLPFDDTLITPELPLLTYGKRVKAKLRTMPTTDGGGNNSAMGDIQRVDRVVVQVDGSGPFKIGMENGTIYEAEGQSLAELKTKYVKYDMPQSPDIENHLYVETDKPTPLHISGLSYRGVSYSGE